jgi:hypothetical protein
MKRRRCTVKIHPSSLAGTLMRAVAAPLDEMVRNDFGTDSTG